MGIVRASLEGCSAQGLGIFHSHEQEKISVLTGKGAGGMYGWAAVEEMA